MADAYRVLGVTETATAAEIKSAYRRQAKRFHPDLNRDPKAAEQFRRVGAAYESLTKGTPFEQPEPQQQSRQRSQSAPTRVPFPRPLVVGLPQAWVGCWTDVVGYRHHIERGFYEGAKWTYSMRGVLQGIDLICTFRFEPHAGFTTDQRDLYTTMKVTRSAIRLSETLRVPNHPNPAGQFIRFPANVKDGDSVVLRGAGIPNNDGPAGNLHVTVQISSPIRDLVSQMSQYYYWIFMLFIFGLLVGGFIT